MSSLDSAVIIRGHLGQLASNDIPLRPPVGVIMSARTAKQQVVTASYAGHPHCTLVTGPSGGTAPLLSSRHAFTALLSNHAELLLHGRTVAADDR